METKKVKISRCFGFKYKDSIYKSLEAATNAYRGMELGKLFPIKSSSMAFYYGYTGSEIFDKWEDLVRIMKTEVVVEDEE